MNYKNKIIVKTYNRL